MKFLFVLISFLYAENITTFPPQSFKAEVDESVDMLTDSTDATSNAFKPVVAFWLGTGIIAMAL
jgi:hypothetical protein